MSAWIRSVTGRAYHFVPIAQNTERTRPMRQVVGENPTGDTTRVWFNSRMRPCQGPDDGATPFTRSILGDVAHQQSARLTCERQRGQHSSLSPFSRGHSSASQSGCFTCIRSKTRLQFAKRTVRLGRLHCRTWEVHPSALTISIPVV